MVSVDTMKKLLSQTLPISDLFSNVDSKSKLDTHLQKKFEMIVPEAVELGKVWIWKKKPTPGLVEEMRKGCCISFLESLRRLLSTRQVRYCVENPRPNECVMRTVLDGTFYKTHPFFSKNANALAVILHYEEIEILNLQESPTHKLGIFSWSLANIYPEMRSSFNAVNLLAVANQCDLKEFGVKKILDNFVQDINVLQTEGISVMANGVPKTFKGSLLMVNGDAPALALLGGFEQSISACRPCRRCMTNQEEWKNCFSEVQFTLRDMETHRCHVESVSTSVFQGQDRKYWQQLYGVNGSSPLVKIDGFDVTQCLVQDVKHVLSEGVLEVETRVFLKWCIDNGLFSIADFNEKVALFDLKHLSVDKPSSILESHLDSKLRQSAAQMLCLSYVVPFILRDLIAAEYLEQGTDTYKRLLCHILLLQVTNMCYAFEVSVEDANYLQNLIEIVLLDFRALYPGAIVPAFHSLIHVPNQIIQFGPLRQQSCMLFEEMHKWFISSARNLPSCKDVPWSLCYRYESLKCVELYPAPGAQSMCLLYKGDVISEGSEGNLSDLPKLKQDLLLPYFDVNDPVLMRTTEVTIHGTSYKDGSLVLLSCDPDSLPVFGKITSMYAHNGIVLCLVLSYKTIGFDELLNAYHLQDNVQSELYAIRMKDNVYPYELSIFYSQGLQYVVLFNHSRTEFKLVKTENSNL